MQFASYFCMYKFSINYFLSTDLFSKVCTVYIINIKLFVYFLFIFTIPRYTIKWLVNLLNNVCFHFLQQTRIFVAVIFFVIHFSVTFKLMAYK